MRLAHSTIIYGNFEQTIMAPWIKQNSQLTKNSESNELDCSLWDLTANEKGTSQVPGTGHRDDGH